MSSIINSITNQGRAHRTQRGAIAFVALVVAELALTSCDSSPDKSPAATAAPPTTTEAANSSGAIDYGPLGAIREEDSTDLDPKFTTSSAKEKLATFHTIERNTHKDQGDQIVTWDQIDQVSAYQRSLFYAVLKEAPNLITAKDRKIERGHESELIQSSCENAGQSGVRYKLDPKVCAQYAPAK